MTCEEREAFLAEVHVGIIGIERQDRAPMTVPIWYAYEPGGELWIVLETDSVKERLLRRAGRFTLCAQTESPPYKFVSVEGPVVSFEASLKERDERAMARRYLGDELADAYVKMTAADPSNRPGIIVTMRPEQWFASDGAKQWKSSSSG
jgi:nitroimidazol reductase NimA-like FMN-containing flavoprotein (pyridoxamine 5'-phosphate oxidase superfamily)